MSLSINLNQSALNAHNSLAATNSALGKSISRLSSGYKINNASDDPAGLVISENLRAQMGGLTQAVANSQDATNMVKTAEGALTEVNSLLKSMRTLAVHAANAGANSTASIAADQSQIASALTSLNNISKNTAFGSLKLLDGSAGASFAILTPTKVAGMSVGAGSGSVFQGKSGSVDITVSTAASQTTRVAAGGVMATGKLATATLAAGETTVVNGVTIGTFTTASTYQNVVDAINGKSTQTGVTASFTAATGMIDLKSTAYGSSQAITTSSTVLGLDSAATKTPGANAAITAISVGGVALSPAEIASFTTSNGSTISNAAGDTIKLTDGAAAGATTGVATLGGQALSFQIGANAGETAQVNIGSTNATALGVNAVDVTTNASAAITTIDAAIAQVSTQRASLGAFQKNVLESNMNSLNVTNENVAASESSIRDTDMAAEMTNFTRLNILAQAGIAMLTQANQQPQQMLSLLR